MSRLPPLTGFDDVRRDLVGAIGRGEIPGSLLIHGPAGIGRQRTALWFAQRVNCQDPGEIEPCGRCTPCKLALQLQHPDIQWFFPLPRPKGAGSADRMVDALEDARAAELAARREHPLRPAAAGEPTGLYMGHVRAIRRLAHTRPAMRGRKIFIVGDAESLVPQEASEEAANALLKLLEEPPPDTTFILTAEDPENLLPTMRSRLLAVRLRPLPEEQVLDFLTRHTDADPTRIQLAARLAQGSIGRALAFLVDPGEEGSLEMLRVQARDMLEAATGEPRQRVAAALAQRPAGARGAFSDVLQLLIVWIRDLAAVTAGAEDRIVNVDAGPALQDLARRFPNAHVAAPEAIRLVDEALALSRINANPQLTLNWLLGSINRTLRDAA